MKPIFRCISLFLFLIAMGTVYAEPIVHILREGETLYSLSRRYDIPLALLIATNKIKDPTSLSVGVKISIPGVYQVKKGDTLYGIALANRVDLHELLALNSFPQDHILHPGDLIHIPDAGEGEVEQDDASMDPPGAIPDAANTVRMVSSTSRPMTPGPGAPAVTASGGGNSAVEKVVEDGKKAEVLKSSGEKPPPFWPHEGERTALSGKLKGTQIIGSKGDMIVSVSSGRVVWIAPFYGYGEMVIVQSDDKHTYTYAGNEEVLVSVGSRVVPGAPIGKLGVTPHEGDARVFFAVFKDGIPIDPEVAPRI